MIVRRDFQRSIRPVVVRGSPIFGWYRFSVSTLFPLARAEPPPVQTIDAPAHLSSPRARGRRPLENRD